MSAAAGDPVLVVIAQPGASLAGELRRLVPDLRATVGDDRRALIGFDRGGPTPDIDPDQFTDLTYTDDTGRDQAWRFADTTTLPLTKTSGHLGAASDSHDEEESGKAEGKAEGPVRSPDARGWRS